MATYTDTTGSGSSTTEFNFTFPTIKDSDVKVALNDIIQATTKYAVDTSGTPKKITFNNTSITASLQESNGAPKSGVIVRVFRDSGVESGDKRVTFQAGSAIKSADLNNIYEHSLYGLEEFQDPKNPNKYNFENLTVTGNATIGGTADITGNVTAPTQSAGDNTTKVATTAFVKTAVDNLIDGAPGSLDTLNELAASLNDDANLSTTLTNSIATKLPLGGGQMTGNITFSGSQTVDGRDLSADGSKLDAIEASAKDDQTAAEIKTLLNSDGIVNAQVDASAAIAGTKISPDFGSQNIVTTGTIASNDITISDTNPSVRFVDSDNDSDFAVLINSGLFKIKDSTNNTDRFQIASDGTVDVLGNLDVGAGLDVTGDITATGVINGKDLVLTDAHPAITYTDSDGNPDYQLKVNHGWFRIHDATNDAERLTVNSDGHVDIHGNLDCLAGVDVTGNITVTGTQEFTLPSGSDKGITLNNPTNTGAHIIADAARTGNGGQNILSIRSKYAGTEVNKIVLKTAGSPSSKGGAIGFYTSTENSGSLTERLKITSDGNIQIDNDSGQLQLGASQDLKLYHGATNAYILNETGNLTIKANEAAKYLYLHGDNVQLRSKTSNEGFLTTTLNGAVKLYFDDSKKLKTEANGVQIFDHLGIGAAAITGSCVYIKTPAGSDGSPTTRKGLLVQESAWSDGNIIEAQGSTGNTIFKVGGNPNDIEIPSDTSKFKLGASGDLSLYHNGTDSYIENSTGNLFIKYGSDNAIKVEPDSKVRLFYDASPKLETSSTGATVTTTNAAKSIKNITTSTSAPSGGSDGDLWFTYT